MPISASKYIKNSESKKSYISMFNYKSLPRGGNGSIFDVYGFFSAFSDIDIPGEQILKFAWDGLVDGFEYSKTVSINESLKSGLSEAANRVKQLIMNDKNIGEHGVNVNFTVFVSTDEGMYIGVFGDSDIYIYKQGKLVDISEMLKSKGAKTAAVAMDDEDLIFASSQGYLKDNLLKLISSKSKNEIKSVLEDLGREIGDDMGIVIFSKERVEEKPKKEESVQEEKVIKPKRRLQPNLKQEPLDTDYIPVSKTSKKVFKPTVHEQDLKEVFSKVSKKLEPAKNTIVKVSSASFQVVKNASGKIVSGVKNIGLSTKSKISNKLGRERWFKKVSAKVSQSGLHRKRKTEFKEFKIDGYKEKNLRFKRVKQFLLIALGVCLIIGGIKFTADQKEARERSKIANETFTKVEKLLNDAQSKLGTNRESAEVSIFQASEELKKIPEELKEDDSKKLNELQAQVLGVQDSLYKRIRLSETDATIEKFYSTSTYNPDSNPQDIAIFRNPGGAAESLIITDLGTKSVLRISLYDNKRESIPDDNKVVSKPFKVYARPDSIFVLDLTNGILKSEYKGGSFQPFVKLSGLSIESIKGEDIVEFAMLTVNENAYILDRGQKALLRSINYEGGYSLVSPYLEKEEYVKANDVFADDMSIYITAEGENGFYRYVNSGGRMVESPIKLTGLDSPVKNALCGHTRDSLDQSLFLFDSGQKRLLMFEKPMESGEKRHPNEMLLLRQYVYDNEKAWNKVVDIVADFDENNAYILDDTTIWKVKL